MLIGIFSFAALGIGLVFQLTIRYISIVRRLFAPRQIFKYFFWSAVFVVFAYYLYLVYAQYIIWLNGGAFTQLLVPPYQSIAYVFGYHFTRFAIYYLISFIVALLLLVLADRLNLKFKRRFFEDDEPYLGALAIFILGNPAWGYAWIYYIIALLLIALLVTSFRLLTTKDNRRFSLYWLWLPVAILVILIKMV